LKEIAIQIFFILQFQLRNLEEEKVQYTIKIIPCKNHSSRFSLY